MSEGPSAPPVANPAPRNGGSWWRLLVIGALLYFVGVVLLVITGNPNLFPTVVIIGSFLVPISYVAFFYDRRHLSRLVMPEVAGVFLFGGLLGVFAASFLEPILVIRPSVPALVIVTAISVGLVEEFAKILGLGIISRGHQHNFELDGLILGAAAGMGFAALESMGYAFTAFVRSQGNLSAAVGITLLRGLLSPLGHGTWTAILAGVLFRESRPGRFHYNGKVIGAYLAVSLLHALWDGLPTFLSVFTPQAVAAIVGEALVGITGLAILWWRWREGVRLQRQKLEPS